MAKRELIAVNGDKRYIRRDEKGRFTPQQDASAAPWHKTAGVKLRQKSNRDKATAVIDAPRS